MDWQIMGRPSTSGIAVNDAGARGQTAIFCAERILSEALASVPLNLLRRQGGKRSVATEHRVQRVIHRKPNPWQTSFEWRRMMQGHAAVRGNGYSEIMRDQDGYPQYLIPRNPDKIKAVQIGDLGVGYGHIMPDGSIRPITPGNMLHFRGPSSDGIKGDTLVGLFRNVIGLAMATDEHAARLFSNGAQVPFAIRHPKALSDKAYERIRASLAEVHGGVSNAHKPMFLEEDMSVEKLGLTGVDSQFLESRMFHILEFARIFRIPPHMLADLSRATFSNIEQLSLEFVTYTMLPWFVMWEQRMDVDLLAEDDQDEFYTKFNLNGLMRADMKTRYESYAVGRQWGWLNANKILELEDMDPIDGPAGETYLYPMNMADAAQINNVADATPAPTRVMAKLLQVRLQNAHQEIFKDAAGRMIRKEVAAFRKAIEKYKDDAHGIEAYADIFYGSHAPVVLRSMFPAFLTYGQAVSAASLMWDAVDSRSIETFIGQYADAFGARYLDTRRAEVKVAISKRNLSQLLDKWDAVGGEDIALAESVAMASAVLDWIGKTAVHA